ncbi:hypothetical protein [Escherichia coli]|uniref:hypothetical protein n=2 Tax=Escherichia coli TaxID=562 RepID=UPI001C402B56|nr:hypothetical protein [Escherichia coli]
MSDLSVNDFAIWVECDNSKTSECLYTKKNNLLIDINFRNDSGRDIYVPFEYLRKTGPAIKLMNFYGSDGFYLRPNLTSKELLSHLTVIHSGESVMFDWVILSSEIESFRKDNEKIKISAKLSVITNIYTKESDVGNKFSKGLTFPIIER